MEPNKRSRHLDTPAESNRDKHVNFLAQENDDIDPGAATYGELFEEDFEDRDDEEDNSTDVVSYDLRAVLRFQASAVAL
jgi:hypothetical protein